MTQTIRPAGRAGAVGPHNPDAPEVTVAPSIPASAGRPAAVPVTVRHRGRVPARLRVSIFGLDAKWAPAPLDLGVMQPGEAAVITLTIAPERGAMGASYPFTIAAESALPIAAKARPVVGVAESVLVLDAADRVSMALTPTTPSAVFSRRIRLDVTNPSNKEQQFSLRGDAAAGARLRLAAKSVTVPAQKTVSVRGRVKVRKPRVFGGDSTHTFTIAARGTGAPEWVEGTLRARPLVGKGPRAIIGVAVIVALWAALAVIFIPKISNSFKKTDTTTSQAAGAGAGAAGTKGAGGAAGASGGSGAGGAGAAGAGGAGANGSGTTSPAGGYQVTGTVTGSGASGASVTLAPVSLASSDDGSLPQSQSTDQTPKALRSGGSAFVGAGSTVTTSSATSGAPQAFRAVYAAFVESNVKPAAAPHATAAATDGPLGKILGPLAGVAPGGFQTTTITTNPKGEFAFGGVTAPGYYLLTIAKAGYQAQRFLINSATLASPQPLKVDLEPGTGALSGTVTGPGGAIGAAQIVVTDGTVTLQTSSVSASTHTGAPGSWQLDQVSTPGTYLVTASSPGLGSTSKLVTLPASGSARVDLALVAGQASITGKVSGEDSLGNVGGLGGITVTATGGQTTRTATTVTSAAMRGSFVLPNLPAPGQYTLTITGDGFLAQTRDVTLGASGASVTVDATLSRADATVSGMVTGTSATGAKQGGLGGVGVTLASNSQTMKTMTTSGATAGSFQFTGVAPGTYVLTAVQFGRVTGSATVVAVASTTKTVNLVLATDVGSELPATAHIRGQVSDSRTGGPLTCDRAVPTVSASDCVATVTVTAPKDPTDASAGTVTYTTTATAALNFVYTIPDLSDPAAGLPPGLYTVTVKAPGYEDTITHVEVAQGQTMPAPPASMPALGIISGTITTRTGTPSAASCVAAVPGTPTLSTANLHCTVNGTTCSIDGINAKCALTSLGSTDGDSPIGTYAIRGLTHGQYTMLLIPQDPEYTAVVNAPPIVTLELGADGQFNSVLDRFGRINLFTVGQDINSGALSPAGNVPVTITPTPGMGGATQTTAADGTLIIKGLNGRYNLAANATDRGSAQVQNLAVGLNQEIDLTMTLTRSVGSFIGRVVTNVDGAKVGVPGVEVTIAGTVDYRSGTAVPGTATATTDDEGCYAVKALASDPVPQNDACTDLASSPTSVAVASFKAVSVTLSANPGTTNTQTPAPMSAEITLGTGTNSPGSLPVMLLVAQPPSFGSHTLTASGPDSSSTSSGLIPAGSGTGQLNLSSTQFTVTSQPAGTGTVTLASAADGTLSFNDSSLGSPNVAMPGDYAIQVQRANFAPLSLKLTCTWNATGTNTCAFDENPELLEYPVITGAITVPAPLPSAIATAGDLQNSLKITRTSPAAGQVTVTPGTPVPVDANGGAVAPADAVNWLVPVTYNDPANSANAPLPMNMAAPGSYIFSVALPAYTTMPVTVNCGSDYTAKPTGGSGTVASGCTTLSTIMGAFPRFAGNGVIALDSSIANYIDSDLSDITATVNGQPNIAVTVDGNSLHWKDNRLAQALPQDVIAPGQYTITVSKPGYDGAIATINCPDAAEVVTPCGPGTMTLQMYPVGVGSVQVNAPLPAGTPNTPDWTHATVAIDSAPVGSDVEASLVADTGLDPTDPNYGEEALLSWKDSSLPADLQGLLRTGDYQVTITIPGYAPTTTTFTCDTAGVGATCGPTGTNSGPVVVNRLPVFSGTVAASPTIADFSGVTFNVTGGPATAGAVSLAATQNGTLTWNDASQPAVNLVTPGTAAYTITATLPGYSANPASVSFTCNPDLTDAVNAKCQLPLITMNAESLLELNLVSNASNGNANNAVFGASVTTSGTGLSASTVQLDGGTSTYIVGQVLNQDGTVSIAGTALNPNGSYNVTVKAPGYTFATLNSASKTTVKCSNGSDSQVGLVLIPGGTTICTITMTELGRVQGSVVADAMALQGNDPIASNDLPGITVTATLLNNGGNPTSTKFSAVSSANGALLITGTTSAEGLAPGNWRLTTPDTSSYVGLSADVTIGSDLSVKARNSSTPTTADGSHSWINISGGTTVTVHLLPKNVSVGFHLNNGAGDITPAGAVVTLNDGVNTANARTCTVGTDGTSVKAGTGYTYTCARTPRPDGTGYYITFNAVPPGNYTYSVTFTNSDYTNISQSSFAATAGTNAVVNVSIAARASTVSGAVLDSAGTPIANAIVQLCAWNETGSSTTCNDVKDFNSKTVVNAKSASDGTFDFMNITDGSYKFVISLAPAYVTTASTLITVKYGQGVSGQTTVKLPTQMQQISLSIQVPAGVDALTGNITLKETNNNGRNSADPDQTLTISSSGGSGTASDPYVTGTAQVPTGTWTVLMPTADNAPFPLQSTSDITVSATTTGSVSVTIGAVDVTPTATFTPADCVAAPTGSVTGNIWPGTGEMPTNAPELSLTMSGSTGASSPLYLPQVTGTYSWNLVSVDDWNTAATTPTQISLTSTSNTLSSSMTVAAATASVPVTLTVGDNTPPSGVATTVTATCTGSGSTPPTAHHDATTDADGTASLTLTTGSAWTYTFTTPSSGYSCTLTATNSVAVACTAPTTSSATVTVDQAGNTNTPAVGAKVSLTPADGATCADTGNDGISTCSNLTPGTPYTISATWTNSGIDYSGTGGFTAGDAGTTTAVPSAIVLAAVTPPTPTTVTLDLDFVAEAGTTLPNGLAMTLTGPNATDGNSTTVTGTVDTTAGTVSFSDLRPSSDYVLSATSSGPDVTYTATPSTVHSPAADGSGGTTSAITLGAS